MKIQNINTLITKAALALAFVFFCLAAKAKDIITTAANGTCGDGVTYTFDSETGALVITKTGEGTGAINDYAFYDHQDIKSVTIGEGVTSIGKYAFFSNTGINSSIVLPNSITKIDAGAFYNSQNISAITIPEGVTTIGNYAFYQCISLTSVEIPASVVSIGSSAFLGMNGHDGKESKLASVTFAEGSKLETIGDAAFQMCHALTSIIIPEGVKTIGEYAFRDCHTLGSITIPASVISIGKYIFDNDLAATVVVTYNGTKEQWDALFGESYRGPVPTTIHFILKSRDVSDIPDQEYIGSAITPEVIVTDGETTLVKGVDYTVTYSNNTNAGTSAKATITGKGNFTGTVEKTFTINPRVTISGALALTEYGNRTTAEINGNYTGSETFTLDNDIAVNSVSFSRTFTDNQYSTIILPFDVPNAANCGEFYTFDGVTHQGNAWIAQVTPVTEIKANTPYLFKPSTATPDLTKDVKKLVATTSIIPENDKWDFVGMYQYKEWAEDADKDYGFAGEEDGDIQIGEFVKVGAGASINPFRCYLTYKGTNNDLSKSAVELPDRIIVRVTDPDATDDDSNTEIITPVIEITADDGIKVWSYNHTAYISAQPGMEYRIVDMSGRTIRHGVTASNREEVSLNGINGIVIVKIGNQTFKIKY